MCLGVVPILPNLSWLHTYTSIYNYILHNSCMKIPESTMHLHKQKVQCICTSKNTTGSEGLHVLRSFEVMVVYWETPSDNVLAVLCIRSITSMCTVVHYTTCSLLPKTILHCIPYLPFNLHYCRSFEIQ